MKPFTLKRPRAMGKFSYGRVPSLTGGVTYRLFRRDDKGALHVEMKRFEPDHFERADIAPILKAMRHALRDRVDELDLKFMGVEA
jgi:hypothetical protein